MTPKPRSIFGSVTLLADNDEPYFSTGEAWDAETAGDELAQQFADSVVSLPPECEGRAAVPHT
jgi:hypothetical protein